MTIDPKTLPDCTVVETRYGETLYTSHDGSRFCRYATAINDDRRVIQGGGEGWLTRVFVPVPDGMTHAEAVAALADAGAWVEVATVNGLPHGARMRKNWRQGDPADDRTYVHRDDLPPTDPDADLIEAMARAGHAAVESPLAWEDRSEPFRDEYRDVARAALAVVREHEAKS